MVDCRPRSCPQIRWRQEYWRATRLRTTAREQSDTGRSGRSGVGIGATSATEKSNAAPDGGWVNHDPEHPVAAEIPLDAVVGDPLGGSNRKYPVSAARAPVGGNDLPKLGPKVLPKCGAALATFVPSEENAPASTSISNGASSTRISRRSLKGPSPRKDAQASTADVGRTSDCPWVKGCSRTTVVLTLALSEPKVSPPSAAHRASAKPVKGFRPVGSRSCLPNEPWVQARARVREDSARAEVR